MANTSTTTCGKCGKVFDGLFAYMPAHEPCNKVCGYVAFYKGKRVEVRAFTKYSAQIEAAKLLGAKKSYDVAIELAEIDGEQVTHTPSF